jgi:arylformamidase
MDAPTHFLSKDDHRTIDEITVDEMDTEGVVLDFTGKKPNTAIARKQLAERAEAYDLSADEYIILDCGMAPADTDRYLRKFVYPSEGAAEYLRETDIACLAVDALSADKPGASIDNHPVHRTLLPEDILILTAINT